MTPEKTSLSPEIVAILQAMAQGLVHDDDGGFICLYCHSTHLTKDILSTFAQATNSTLSHVRRNPDGTYQAIFTPNEETQP